MDLRDLPASGHDLLLRGGDDVTDIGVGAVVGIEVLAAVDEGVEFCLEQGEVPDACTHGG